jgi:LAGLIDADG DNA endonuclease family protein/cytochrome c oxidase subunit II-like protein
MYKNIYVYNNIIKLDAPTPWGLFFQDSATPQMEGIEELHNNIMFYLAIILFTVTWMMITIIKSFVSKKSLISHKYMNHGTLIELIWTITPAIILILIAFPSFKLLYLMDEVMDPSLVIYGEGLFFGGLILYILNKIKDIFYNEKNTILISNFTLIKKIKPIQLLVIKNNNKFIFKRSFHTKVKASKRIGPHNEDILSVLVGSLLGDCYGNKRSGEGTRFCYRQSIVHKDYLFWLYNFFYTRGYCSNLEPRKYTRILNKKSIIKEHYGYEFNTFTFRSFNWIHDMFYHKGKKKISLKIENYLTPLSLAVWIMDDGGWANPGVRISTYNFELKEVKFLVSLLKKLYDLDCTVQILKNGTQSSIYIKKESLSKLINLVLPYMHNSMYYKLGINI